MHHHFVRASSRLAQQWTKLCYATKQTGPTCNLVAKFLKRSVVACSSWISCFRGRMLWTRPQTGVCEPLMPDVVAPKVHPNNQLTFGFTMQEFSMVGSYTEDLNKLQNCHYWWVGTCAGMGTCPGQYGIVNITTLMLQYTKWQYQLQWVLTFVRSPKQYSDSTFLGLVIWNKVIHRPRKCGVQTMLHSWLPCSCWRTTSIQKNAVGTYCGNIFRIVFSWLMQTTKKFYNENFQIYGNLLGRTYS